MQPASGAPLEGKVASYLALRDGVKAAARGGSINAGHTVVHQGRTYRLRLVPSAVVNPSTRLYIGAGANLEPGVLLKELEATGAGGRLWIDPNCSIIEPIHVERDRGDPHLREKIGTTGSGIGPAVADRALRVAKTAREIPELQRFIGDVAGALNEAIDRGEEVQVEGTQGLYLSLYHGTYPYTVARDTTAAAFLSEVGIGPKKVDEVILVLKSFVTRVGGGLLPGELPPEEAERRGWTERATVTGRLRRTAPFNHDLARRAAMINGATQVAITKLDVLFPECKGARSAEKLSAEARRFIESVEERVKTPVALVGTGQEAMDMIDLREKRR